MIDIKLKTCYNKPGLFAVLNNRMDINELREESTVKKSKKLRKIMKAATMGKPWAMYKLGLMYINGNPFPQDPIEAAVWIEWAAALEYAPAIEWVKKYDFAEENKNPADPAAKN